ncbi:hypothetical protein KAR91_59985 [Candidatus Pacearchaeota archaeon]|nr:hypothetical protein [Candidatus Pacearchaeota archaeon]
MAKIKNANSVWDHLMSIMINNKMKKFIVKRAAIDGVPQAAIVRQAIREFMESQDN